MRKSYLQLLLGGIIIVGSLVSCEKDDKICVKCFSYNDRDFGFTENCVGNEFIETEETLDNLATAIEGEGYKIKYSENCY